MSWAATQGTAHGSEDARGARLCVAADESGCCGFRWRHLSGLRDFRRNESKALWISWTFALDSLRSCFLLLRTLMISIFLWTLPSETNSGYQISISASLKFSIRGPQDLDVLFPQFHSRTMVLKSLKPSVLRRLEASQFLRPPWRLSQSRRVSVQFLSQILWRPLRQYFQICCWIQCISTSTKHAWQYPKIDSRSSKHQVFSVRCNLS